MLGCSGRSSLVCVVHRDLCGFCSTLIAAGGSSGVDRVRRRAWVREGIARRGRRVGGESRGGKGVERIYPAYTVVSGGPRDYLLGSIGKVVI